MSRIPPAQLRRFEEMYNRPDNRECADCTARQPRWASTNLGILLCLRCAGLHRSVGVHISKVKSTTMDVWTEDMMQCVSRIGNGTARRLYEAQLPSGHRRPEATTSSAEVERFIRAKYEHRRYAVPDLEEQLRCVLSATPSVTPRSVAVSPLKGTDGTHTPPPPTAAAPATAKPHATRTPPALDIFDSLASPPPAPSAPTGGTAIAPTPAPVPAVYRRSTTPFDEDWGQFTGGPCGTMHAFPDAAPSSASASTTPPPTATPATGADGWSDWFGSSRTPPSEGSPRTAPSTASIMRAFDDCPMPHQIHQRAMPAADVSTHRAW